MIFGELLRAANLRADVDTYTHKLPATFHAPPPPQEPCQLLKVHPCGHGNTAQQQPSHMLGTQSR